MAAFTAIATSAVAASECPESPSIVTLEHAADDGVERSGPVPPFELVLDQSGARGAALSLRGLVGDAPKLEVLATWPGGATAARWAADHSEASLWRAPPELSAAGGACVELTISIEYRGATYGFLVHYRDRPAAP